MVRFDPVSISTARSPTCRPSGSPAIPHRQTAAGPHPGSNQPGAVLQRYEDGQWRDYVADGQLVVSPVDMEQLPPGRYRLEAR